MDSRLDRAARVAVPLLAALVGAFLYHRYSILTGLDRVQADPGDSRFIAFLLEHWNNVVHGAAQWRSPPIFWPVQGTLAYSDALVGMGAVHAALRPFLGIFAAMNLQLILLSLASFAAAYALLARGFGIGVWGASFGAYFFAFSWPRFAELVHVQLQFTPPLPLLVLLALEMARDGMRLTRGQFAWRAGLFAVLLAVLLATTLYYAIFIALALTVAILLCLLSRAARRHLFAVVRRHLAGIAGAAVLAALLTGPVIALYLPIMRQSRGRPWTEVLPSLPRPIEFLWLGRENFVWGWLFSRWPSAVIDARWPGLRIGVGALASIAWGVGIVWAIWTLAGRRRSERVRGPVALVVLTGTILQLLILRVPGDHSAWWLVWKVFPGARGLRAVARLELLVTLAMAVWLGFLLDAGLRLGRAVGLGAAALAVLLAVEQFGRVAGYSGRGAEALSDRVAQAIRADCAATYIVATPDLLTVTPDVDEAHFDGPGYLAANPDVAATWKETPWEHYRRYGRAEHRVLDPAQAGRHMALMYFAYNYTIPLAADLARRPVVNGLSGWQPPGWQLFDVLSPAAPPTLAEWLRLSGKAADAACVVPVRITLDMIPDLPPGLWP